jgi:hypothetical protein
MHPRLKELFELFRLVNYVPPTLSQQYPLGAGRCRKPVHCERNLHDVI